jgi:L-ascorbate metabolism protein UlaG (beta-lactamase superfamily)
MEYKGIKIEKLLHATFRISFNEYIIYIDPFTNSGEMDYYNMVRADLILISHEHFDHCDKDAVDNLIKDTTIILGNEKVKETLENSNVEIVNQYFEKEVGNIKLETIPAYNTNKFRAPNLPFHPRDNGGVGYIINLGGVRIYHTGDTDLTEEMKQVKDIDVMLVPISGTYVMTPDEAAEAVNLIKPKIAFPMHIDAIVGGSPELEKFEELMEDSDTEVVRN